MEADLARMPTGTSGWHALVDYACSLGDLSEIDWFELKTTLPFGTKADKKRSAVVLARAVLGMANRMPDAAGKHLSGHGVILVGIQGPAITGAEKVDGAQLHDALDPYVGQDGLRWDYTFINHPNGLVMAITVDPPKWGDPIFTFQKEFSDAETSIRDGEVFARVLGKTRPASSQDSRDLQRRLTASPSTNADVEIQYVGTFDRVFSSAAVDLVNELVDDFADRKLATAELPPASPGRVSTTGIAALMSATGGRRQPYIQHVENWRTAAHEKSSHVAREFLRHELARGRLTAINNSDRYLQAVRVQVQFSPAVTLLVRSDTEYCDHGGSFNVFAMLPERPSDWEQYRGYDLGLLAGHRPTAAPVMSMPSEFDVRTNAAGNLLTWDLGDLRPRATEISHESVAVITSSFEETVTAQWQVTARGVDHVFKGTSVLACEQESASSLYWRGPRGGGPPDCGHEHDE